MTTPNIKTQFKDSISLITIITIYALIFHALEFSNSSSISDNYILVSSFIVTIFFGLNADAVLKMDKLDTKIKQPHILLIGGVFTSLLANFVLAAILFDSGMLAAPGTIAESDKLGILCYKMGTTIVGYIFGYEITRQLYIKMNQHTVNS